ncbi:endothelin-converting enzyme homolog [Nephila pilipes]|uniref:Endothelin-converting enzyme homolog n=1 Tax=Nephila pilipes TaxID=299642 RepID=A0A8X6UF01_NEPPI|nr:endothelin-converting enzyme homolog [Nephila pilipes]
MFGHEEEKKWTKHQILTHSRSKRNATGEISNWWTEETKQIFENKSDCFVKQYNKYGLDGRRTLVENIADNGGLQQAYTAFLSWKEKQVSNIKLPKLEEYSIDQLFFIAYGSIWCIKYAPGILNYTIREAEHAPSPYRFSSSKSFPPPKVC